MTTREGNEKLADMAALLERFAGFKSAKQAARRDRIAEFLEFFEMKHYESLTTGPVDFNIFEALKVSDYEIRHSAFLAWLLDPRSGHKQGVRFLEHFVEASGIEYDLGGRKLPIVRTEHRERRAFIDIMIYVAGELLVYIENKVGAREGRRQLISEFRDMREVGARIGVPETHQYAVFLTPYGRMPETHGASEWHQLSYAELAGSFATVLPNVASEKLRCVVEDWIAIAQQIGDRR